MENVNTQQLKNNNNNNMTMTPNNKQQHGIWSCHQLAQQLSLHSNISNRVLILDVRPLSQLQFGHIVNAVHICVPQTLLKRKNFTFANIEATLGCHESRERLQLRESADVILCDTDGTSFRKTDSCLGPLVSKFQEEKLVNSVSILEGGFQAFAQTYPDFCTKKKEKPSPSSLSLSHNHHPASAPILPSSSPSPFCLSLPICSKPAPLADLNGPAFRTTLSDDKGEPARILDFLYVGDQQMAAHEATLEKYGITCVLNTATECPNFFANNPKYTYLRLDLTDSASQCLTGSIFERAFNFIDQARLRGEKVLVHCQAGQSRSATIIISYIIKTFKWNLRDAYQYTQSKRKSVSPNLGFMAQLSQFEKSILGESSPLHSVFTDCGRVLTTPQFLDCAA